MSFHNNNTLQTIRLRPRTKSFTELAATLNKPEQNELPTLRSPRQRYPSNAYLPPLSVRSRCNNSISKVRTSKKHYGVVKSFAVCTNQGLVRSYNEDRVTIIPRTKLNELDHRISYFGVFDGHGGAGCADYLAENLHEYFFTSLSKESDITKSLKNSFSLAEKTFFSSFFKSNYESSGSCALTCVLYGGNLYLANVGDSRAILGSQNGQFVYQLTVDHKPSNKREKNRIEMAGGKIISSNEMGVSRIFPGKLSLTRAFGDFSAKVKSLGGNPDVLIAKPEIFIYPLSKDYDYVLLASDGVYDVLSNEEVNNVVWEALEGPGKDIHEKAGNACKAVIDQAMKKNSTDNVTCIIVLLKDF